ncbi:Methyltransferase domain-containing protein [Ruegeria halocynthiae]|uniref:Methyltransferase domain-containing protein n=1 Tax=Ruegeria halocynthiae TaxID=985054 RepID=A0A1H3F3C9_9RHOB|nr:class I SAM-dependent methyltransferase [Ruegeria halocynthiae]SDX85481.1 Methyltransferase domain-containing protein [Ruegeria halocynthiae]
MTDDWNDYADGWDDNNDVRYYASRAFASLDEHLDLCGKNWKSKRVLDFGCGTGLLAEKIAPHVAEVVAVDTSENMIAVLKAKNLPNVRAVHGDMLAGNVQEVEIGFSGFDLICASSVCAFLPDYRGAVAVLAGLLHKGGQFVQWDWQASDDNGFGLTLHQMKTALEAARLGSIRVEQVFEINSDARTMPVLMGAGICITE